MSKKRISGGLKMIYIGLGLVFLVGGAAGLVMQLVKQSYGLAVVYGLILIVGVYILGNQIIEPEES